MKSLNRSIVESSNCFDSTFQRFHVLTFLLAAIFIPVICRAEFQLPETGSARSISGQFIVVGPSQHSPLANSPQIVTNAEFVRLAPALLAVSAERVKESLWHEFGISGQWRGQIVFLLHPAQSSAEEVVIVSKPSADGWNYQIQLPDVLPRTRFMRAMTGALLLEFANRNAQSHSAEIPAWLIDGLSQQLLAENSGEIILSSPDKIVKFTLPGNADNGAPENLTSIIQHGIDPLADARRALKNSSALTFEQLSWPTAGQLSGADGGVYRASAQLFVSDLLKLKNGPAKLRLMLETLPRFYNWQNAFQSVFRENFPRPLDVEKWWAVQVISFAARDAGPAWTPAFSRVMLDEILSVPVEFYSASNALPVRAEISIQTAIRNLDSDRQTSILRLKLRDLQLAQLRMARPLAALTDNYCRVLSDYLGNGSGISAAKNFKSARTQTDVRATVKKLDKLDAQRRTIEADIKPAVSFQPDRALEFQ
jgi:hypothetical protein